MYWECLPNLQGRSLANYQKFAAPCHLQNANAVVPLAGVWLCKMTNPSGCRGGEREGGLYSVNSNHPCGGVLSVTDLVWIRSDQTEGKCKWMDVNVELDLRGRLRPNLHNFMRSCFCQSNAKLNTVDVFHNMSQFHFTSELVALKQFQPLQHNVDYRREQCWEMSLVTRRSNGPCMYVTTYNCQVTSEIKRLIFMIIEGVVTFLNILDFSMWLDQLASIQSFGKGKELKCKFFNFHCSRDKFWLLHIFRSSKPSFLFWHAELLNNRSVLNCLQSWQKTWLWKGRRRMTDSASRDRGRLVDANKAVMNKHTAPVYLDNIHTTPPIHAPSSVYANLLANATEHQANNKADS